MNSTDIEQNADRKFELKAAVDPLTPKILQARNQCLTDRKLSDGARMYFCFLLDGSLDFDRWYFKGAYRASMLFLSSTLSRCKRSFYTWNQELVDGGYIWISKLPGKNTHCFNLYHITAIHPPKSPGYGQRGENWGNGGTHPGFKNMGTGARKGLGGAFNAPSQQSENSDNSPILQNLTPASGKNMHLSAASSATASRNICDSQPQSLPLPAADSATASRKDLPLPAASPCGSEQHQLATLEETEGLDRVKIAASQPSKYISKGKKPLVSGKQKVAEDHFLERMGFLILDTFGQKALKHEAEKFGAQWRARFREDADRAERALMDTKVAAREGRVKTSIGAHWNIAWLEFASRKKAGIV